MLTTQSYVVALTVVFLAGIVGLALLARWLPARWPAGLRWALIGGLAGLLLTPALPSEEASTLAPALVVVVFNTLFGDGWASAVPAAAQLIAAMVLAALIGGFLGFLKGRRAPTDKGAEAVVES